MCSKYSINNKNGLFFLIDEKYKQGKESSKTRKDRIGFAGITSVVSVSKTISQFFAELLKLEEQGFLIVFVFIASFILVFVCVYMIYGLIVNYLESCDEDDLLLFEIKDLRDYIVLNEKLI